MTRISVFLPSYNKGGFAIEAIESVVNQGFPGWELWVLENSTDGTTRELVNHWTWKHRDDQRIHYRPVKFTDAERREYAIAPVLINQYYPHARGDIILYISDDDLFMPNLFGQIVQYFDTNPEHDALYFSMARTWANTPGTGTTWGEQLTCIPATVPRGNGQVDCQIDGGQVAYRKKVLDVIGQPYYHIPKDEHASHSDGLHLQTIAEHGIIFHPLPVSGLIHRHTNLSVWSPGA